MLNRIILQARLCRDVELRRLPSGKSVASVSVACDRDFTNKETNEKETDFIDIVAFGTTADHMAKYYSKGSMIIVSGRLQIRAWSDKEGNKRRSAEVVADNVYFGESKRQSEGGSYAAPAAPAFGGYSAPSAPASDFAMLDDDDAQLPF